jgi:hypothetical protein
VQATKSVIDYEDIRARVAGAVGEGGARELLDVLTRSEADRAALIGRLSLRADAGWLAELLIDLEEDGPARLHLIEALRQGI